MEHLYTPWRMSYLRGEGKKPDGCVFCTLAAAPDEATKQVVCRSKHVFVTLNLYPYNSGHLMIVPYEHVPSPEKLGADVLTDLMLTMNDALAALRVVYSPQGFNIGANLGAAAGAGIADHFHLHIVPRWGGDSSYLTVIGNTRTIPELLEDTWRRLREAWPQRSDPK